MSKQTFAEAAEYDCGDAYNNMKWYNSVSIKLGPLERTIFPLLALAFLWIGQVILSW